MKFSWNPLSIFAKAATPAAGGSLAPVSKGPELPLVVTPKVSNKQITIPAYVPTAAFVSSQLQRKDINASTTDIAATSRLGNTTPAVIRQLSRLHPDLSAAVNAYLRTGIPEKYILKAKNPDGSLNREATQLAQTFARRLDTMPDYASGYSPIGSIRSTAEALAKEGLIEGALAMELVLDKFYMPYKFQPVAVSQLIWREDKDVQHVFPQQLISGQYIDLDQPTFFYTSIDQDLLSVYSQSPLEGSVQPVLASADFIQDMRRIIKRAVFPRMDVVIDEAKLKERIPPEIENDPTKLDAFLNATISAIQTMVTSIGPEDALVHFDFITVTQVAETAGDNAQSFETVKDIYDEKVSTGAKVLPSVLGHGSGSQNVASTETLVFMLSANGLIRLKLQEMFSKAFTLSARLFGYDVTVEFLYQDINLRPELELESFRAMRQSRMLEQLSLGFLTDDEAALELTGNLTPVGFKPLSGTQFFKGAPPVNENPLGNQQGALNQSLKPSTPTKKKGKQ
jgi:hypothetical protein